MCALLMTANKYEEKKNPCSRMTFSSQRRTYMRTYVISERGKKLSAAGEETGEERTAHYAAGLRRDVRLNTSESVQAASGEKLNTQGLLRIRVAWRLIADLKVDSAEWWGKENEKEKKEEEEEEIDDSHKGLCFTPPDDTCPAALFTTPLYTRSRAPVPHLTLTSRINQHSRSITLDPDDNLG